MFKIFKRKKEIQEEKPQLVDLDGNTLKEGDLVMSLRYDLGKCKIVLQDGTYFYQSEQSGQQVSWYKMIDATTQKQKVKLHRGE